MLYALLRNLDFDVSEGSGELLKGFKWGITWTIWHFRKITLEYIIENGVGVVQMGLKAGRSVRRLLQ